MSKSLWFEIDLFTLKLVQNARRSPSQVQKAVLERLSNNNEVLDNFERTISWGTFYETTIPVGSILMMWMEKIPFLSGLQDSVLDE